MAQPLISLALPFRKFVDPDTPSRSAWLVLLPDLVRNERTWKSMVRRLAPLQLRVVGATALIMRRNLYASLYAGSVVKQHNRGRPSAASVSVTHESATT